MPDWVRLLPLAAAFLPAAVVALPHDWRFLPLHVAVLAAAVALAWRAPLLESELRDAPIRRWLLMGAGGLAMAWMLFGASSRAHWGVIDDHEIHTIIGAGRERIPPAELAARIRSHRECGSPPLTMTRYRPAYYLFRLTEASAWGKDIRPWMRTRFVLFVIAAVLAFDMLRQWLGFVGGGLALALFAVLAMWPEIVVQLGPPECYAASAVVAFAWCCTHILRSPTPAGAAIWMAVAATGVIAIGCKENFVVLAPLALLVAGVEWRRGRLGAAGVAACLAVSAAAAWVAFVVAAGIIGNGGRDVYQRPVGLGGFVRHGDASPLRAIRKLVGYGLPLLAATGWMGLVAWRQRRLWPQKTAVVPAVGMVLGLVALSQFFFYRGEVFKKCRYDFPFVAVLGVLLIGLLVAASQWTQGGPQVRRLRRRLLVPAALAVLAMVIGGDRSRAATHAYVAATTTFSDTIQRVAADCRTDPSRPVAFILARDAGANYEPVVSVAAYLRSLGVENPLHLSPEGLPTADSPGLVSFQERRLAELSRDGDERFRPWSGLSATAPIELWFSADPPPGRSRAYRFR